MENAQYAKYKFEIDNVYKDTTGRKYKCLSRDAETAKFAPMSGCIVKKVDAFVREIRVYLVTKREQVKVSERGEYVWMQA